jgi:hypothetical protein
MPHPVPHRGVERHAAVAADVDQGAAAAQLLEDSVGGFSRVARHVAESGFARQAIGRGKAVMVVVDPALHRAGGRHAVVAAQKAQRAAGVQLMQNAFGEFGCVALWACHGPFQGNMAPRTTRVPRPVNRDFG